MLIFQLAVNSSIVSGRANMKNVLFSESKIIIHSWSIANPLNLEIHTK